MIETRTVAELASLIRGRTRGHGGAKSAGVCIFLGAGASISAGIKSASGFVNDIREKYPEIYESVCSRRNVDYPSYGQAMEALPPAQQIELIRSDIARARVNWAHLGIARLEAAGIVDTIVTTNFDPLVSRACALMNRFPAVYDLAALRDADHRIAFEGSLVDGSAIYHLHGQHTGFLLLSTPEKLAAQAARVRPVLEQKMRGKLIIVWGYSGANDPLVAEIRRINPSEHGLYWVCHDHKDPAPNVCRDLLSLDNCHVIRRQPSDQFFLQLANRLNAPIPDLFANPFKHMRKMLEDITPYTDDIATVDRSIHEQALKMMDSAIAREKAMRPHYESISRMLSAGRYEDLLKTYSDPKSLHKDERDLILWAAV